MVDRQRHGDKIDLVLRELYLPTISNKETNSLLAPFSDHDQIQAAMFDIGNDRSPGLDGFPSEFFKTYWPIPRNHVIQAINRFLSTKLLLKEWNCSLPFLFRKLILWKRYITYDLLAFVMSSINMLRNAWSTA